MNVSSVGITVLEQENELQSAKQRKARIRPPLHSFSHQFAFHQFRESSCYCNTSLRFSTNAAISEYLKVIHFLSEEKILFG